MAEITADILDRAAGPALTASSDMPVLEAPQQEALADATPPPVAESAAAPAEPVAEPSPGEAASAEGGEGEAGAEGEAEAAGEGEPPPPPVEPPKPKRIGPVQQRVNELTAERRIEAAKREAAEAHALRLEELLAKALADKQSQPEAQPEAPPPPPIEEPRPMREAFDTPEAYDEALIEWSATRAQQRADHRRAVEAQTQKVADQAKKEADDKAAAEQASQANFKALQDSHMARRATALERLPDYAEVAERDDLKISMPMGLAIMQNDGGPDVAYYLGQHPEVADRIAAMVLPGQVFPPGNPMAGQPVPDVQRQLIEMGKVFAIVAAEQAAAVAATAPPPAPLPPVTPPPPAPINPIRRGTAPAVTRTLEEIGNEGSMEEYAAARMRTIQEERDPTFLARRRVN